MITITQFEEFYTQDVIDLVLHFQNDGTRPIVTVADQPDLLHITNTSAEDLVLLTVVVER